MRLDLDASTNLRPLLDALARTDDPRPGLQAAVDAAQVELVARLHRGIRPPLARATIERRARRGLSPRPLTGGELERSLAGEGRYAVERVNYDDARVGTRDPVANVHEGRNRKGTRLPRRVVVSPTARVRDAVQHALGVYLTEGVE